MRDPNTAAYFLDRLTKQVGTLAKNTIEESWGEEYDNTETAKLDAATAILQKAASELAALLR